MEHVFTDALHVSRPPQSALSHYVPHSFVLICLSLGETTPLESLYCTTHVDY